MHLGVEKSNWYVFWHTQTRDENFGAMFARLPRRQNTKAQDATAAVCHTLRLTGVVAPETLLHTSHSVLQP
jgi:hypothetical protein